MPRSALSTYSSAPTRRFLPAVLPLALLVCHAEGVAAAESGADEAHANTAAGSAPARTRLQPRWIEPRRREPRPPAASPSPGLDPGATPALDTAASAADGVIGRAVGTGDASRSGAEPGYVAGKDWKRDARVIIHGPRSGARLSELVTALLRDLGAGEIERRLVEDGPAIDQVRFFDTADARMAADVAAVLEPAFGEVQVQDFTHYEPSPESGLLELWLR